MIRTLQKKFIKTAMIAITALIAAMLIGINIYNLVSVNRQIHERVDLLSRYGGDKGGIPGDKKTGFIPEGSTDETGGEGLPELPSSERGSDDGGKWINDMTGGRIRERTDEDIFRTSIFFTVRFDSEGNIISVNNNQISQVSEEDASALALEVYESGKENGKLGTYVYELKSDMLSNEKILVFLDVSEERLSLLRIGIVSLIVGIAGWLLMLALVVLLSKRAIRPIAENIEKQKQFVTNAGHDLKTPLAIIQANCEAMELFNGENKWSANIKTQVSRMSDLTKNLLTLARMDESSANMVMEDLDMTALVNDSLKSFTGPFELKNVELETDIEDGVHYKGDKGQLSQLLSLLLDNSVKYVNEGGNAKVTLAHTDKKVIFTISNTCESLPEDPPERLFDRFYRSDSSRSQKTGGHGIGLSVASSIVDNHKGTIKAQYTGSKTIEFTVTL